MSGQVLLQILMKGGLVTGVILVFGLIALILIVERFLTLRRAQIDVQDFLPGVINTLRSQDVKQAVIICDETPGPAAHIVRQAIMHCEEGREGMYRASREACLSELPRLERYMKALLTIVHITPLLGLLGTVIGMIAIFQRMVESKAGIFMPMTEMAGDLQGALISTAAGLTVAIPTYLGYNYFRELIDNILIEMDKAAAEIIYFLCENPEQLPQEDHDAVSTRELGAVAEERPKSLENENGKSHDDTQELGPESKASKVMQDLREKVGDGEKPAVAAKSDDSPTDAFMKSFGPGTKSDDTTSDDREALPSADEQKPGESPTQFFMRHVDTGSAAAPAPPSTSNNSESARHEGTEG